MRERIIALEKRIEEVMMTPVERAEQNISVKQSLVADLYTKRVTVEPGYNDRVLAAYGVADAELVRLEPRNDDEANGIRGNKNRAGNDYTAAEWAELVERGKKLSAYDGPEKDAWKQNKTAANLAAYKLAALGDENGPCLWETVSVVTYSPETGIITATKPEGAVLKEEVN